MMKRIFRLLLSRNIIMGIGFLLLMLLVWFAGPMIGIEDRFIRLLIICIVLLIWIVTFLTKKILATQKGRFIEESIHEEAEKQIMEIRPDRKEEIQALQDQLNQAIKTLKSSKMGRSRWRSAALYELPWYMMIGPPASGKSTAIRHSGLNFPYLGSGGKGIQGVGGTRNCDWWFTNEAILLDTAGRYTIEDDDKEEWLGFLDMLKKARKKKPINGVMVAVSIADLMNADEEGVEWHAKNIRNRIDELIQRLGILFPIYLIFTKCDLIQGFVESFGDLTKDERAQVWGCTLTDEQQHNPQVDSVFEQEFEVLYKALNSRRLERLTSETRLENKQNVYFFPLQFSSIQKRLSRFLSTLFESNPYQERPLLRGFYFTSGTQEGTPIDNVIGAMSRAFGLSGDIFESLDQAKETKSYFIKDLFTRIIFPDQGLAGPSSGAEQRLRFLRIAGLVGSILVLAGITIGLLGSFIGNKRLLSTTANTARKVQEIKWEDWDLLEENLKTLDSFRTRVSKLDIYDREGAPFPLRWGLYRGDTIIPPVRQLYFARLKEILLNPIALELEEELKGISKKSSIAIAGFPYYYDILKTYLMMANPSRTDPAFLSQRLKEIMEEQTSFKELPQIKELVQRQSDFYLEQIYREDAPRIIANEDIVRASRKVIKTIPTLDRIFSRIKEEGNKKFESYTLTHALNNQRQNVLFSRYSVPGFFTPRCWQSYFKDAIVREGEEILKEDWILTDTAEEFEEEDNKDKIIAGLTELYTREYVKEWRRFLKGITVRSFANTQDAAEKLTLLTGDYSPLVQLLKEVGKNTTLEKKPFKKTRRIVTGLFDKAKKKLGLKEKEEKITNEEPPKNLVEKDFKDLHKFVTSQQEDKRSPLKIYISEILKIREKLHNLINSDDPEREARYFTQDVLSKSSGEELHEAWRLTERLLRDFGPEKRDVIEHLLRQPIINTLTAVMHDSQRYLDRIWRAEVYEPYQRSLQLRYPFSRIGEDAALIDVSEFFHPSDGIFWDFYERELRPFLIPKKNTWRTKTWLGKGISFSPAFLNSLSHVDLITRSLFPRGSSDPRVSFELYPYPTPGLSQILLVIDSQSYSYRMGPQVWKTFSWPGTTGAIGSKIQISDEQSGFRQDKSFEGRWGFFRLMDAGRVTQESPTRFRVEWSFNRGGIKTYNVRFDLKAHSYRNPFRQGLLSKFKCPGRITAIKVN